MSRSDQNHKYHWYDIIRKLVMDFGLKKPKDKGSHKEPADSFSGDIND